MGRGADPRRRLFGALTHLAVAKAIVSSGAAQDAKAIAGDLRGFRAKRVLIYSGR
jgi:hypothetical protein